MLHAVPYQLRSWKCHGRSAHTPHGSLDSRACGLLVSFCTCRASIHSGFLSSPKKSLPPRAPPRRSACPLSHHSPRAAMPPVLHHQVATSGMVPRGPVVILRRRSKSGVLPWVEIYQSKADNIYIYSFRYSGNSMKIGNMNLYTYTLYMKSWGSSGRNSWHPNTRINEI